MITLYLGDLEYQYMYQQKERVRSGGRVEGTWFYLYKDRGYKNGNGKRYLLEVNQEGKEIQLVRIETDRDYSIHDVMALEMRVIDNTVGKSIHSRMQGS
ncbi:hypothetical protein [Bacillus badius]|uniref:hypothetical protein n=1 Tax=Bacillus badius TaxID=1455 RepID=UPI0007B38DF4|nr:hypothetical protein [Bacillus badius]KZR59364.1 hypothetical protein A3781_13260 [Bacillus badius]